MSTTPPDDFDSAVSASTVGAEVGGNPATLHSGDAKSSGPTAGAEGRANPVKFGLGPGLIVAAAFVGPGTVTTAAKAGATQGLGLVWVVVLSVVGVIILQEMAARLGTLTGRGLGEILRRQSRSGWSFAGLVLLVVAAIGAGNAAYQTGNLMGAAIGLAPMLGLPLPALVLICGSVAFALLASGSYRLLERVLMGAVAVMGAGFVAAAGLAVAQRGVSWSDLRPIWPATDYGLVLALIGTTMVPYNLFLHASVAAERWGKVRPRSRGLALSRLDSSIGIALGGVVTLAILVATALTTEGGPLTTAADAMRGLEAVLGTFGARVTFSLGLAAAGLSSAITAPLAAAYAISGLLGWSTDKNSRSFRAIWSAVLLTGLVLAMWFGASPTETIIAAQAANALVLPVIAVVLWMACNNPSLGQYANGRGRNLAVALVVVMIGLLTFGRWWF